MPSATERQIAHLIDIAHVKAIDVLGPTIQFLTSPEDSTAPCIMRGSIPAGVSIPLHSHGDPETFVMISGTVEGLIHRAAAQAGSSAGAGRDSAVPADIGEVRILERLTSGERAGRPRAPHLSLSTRTHPADMNKEEPCSTSRQR